MSRLSLALALALAACSGADPATDDVGGDGGKGDCATCSSLSANDRLRIASHREAQRWSDGNISTGGVWMDAGKLADATEASIRTAAEGLLRAEYKADKYEDLPGSATVRFSAPVQVYVEDEDDFVLETAERVATDGQSYASQNESGRAAMYWGLQHTLDWLPSSGSTVTGINATTSVDDGNGPKAVTLTLFVNSTTREYLEVYVREGTI